MLDAPSGAPVHLFLVKSSTPCVWVLYVSVHVLCVCMCTRVRVWCLLDCEPLGRVPCLNMRSVWRAWLW